MWEFLGLVSVLLLIGFPVLAIAAFYRTTKLTERQAKFEKLVITKICAIEDRLSEIADIAVTPSSVVAEKTSDESLSEEPASDESEGSDAPEPDTEAPDQESEDEPETQEAVDEPIAARSSPWPISEKPKSNPFDLESLVGGRWSVLLGGLALALGIVFLVKYSIEEGLLGPGPRTVLGGLVSAALLAVGEWLRRSDRDFDLPVYAKADVPGILTGAGAIGAFATLYAAHALYGFVGPGIAFVALGLTRKKWRDFLLN